MPKIVNERPPAAKPLGLRPTKFLQLVPISRQTMYNMIRDGELEYTKVRGALIILTDPEELLRPKKAEAQL